MKARMCNAAADNSELVFTKTMTRFAQTGSSNYYAVIFTSQLVPEHPGYEEMADRMVELARQMPGYLGIESARGTDGLGITVSYWQTESDVTNWKRQTEHLAAQQRGKEKWYTHYELRVARVERGYSGPAGR